MRKTSSLRLGPAERKGSSQLLFDASAIINLILYRSDIALGCIRDNWILDLTIYEAGNTIWKTCELQEKIEPEEAADMLDAVLEISRWVRLIPVLDLSLQRTLEIAISHRTTFYDAAYVSAAKDKKLTLVTDDSFLSRVAEPYVKTTTSKNVG